MCTQSKQNSQKKREIEIAVITIHGPPSLHHFHNQKPSPPIILAMATPNLQIRKEKIEKKRKQPVSQNPNHHGSTHRRHALMLPCRCTHSPAAPSQPASPSQLYRFRSRRRRSSQPSIHHLGRLTSSYRAAEPSRALAVANPSPPSPALPPQSRLHPCRKLTPQLCQRRLQSVEATPARAVGHCPILSDPIRRSSVDPSHAGNFNPKLSPCSHLSTAGIPTTSSSTTFKSIITDSNLP